MKLSELINFQSNKKRLEMIKNNRKNIVPFIGAGVSKACGLFTWGELLHKLAVDYLTVDEICILEKKGDFFEYADKIVEASGNSDIIMKRIREIFSEVEMNSSEVPYLLVTMFSAMIITTNYDTLLEDSSKGSSMGSLKPLLPCLTGQVNEAIQLNSRTLLKIHGSVEETQSFIFTSEQYKKFYGEKGDRENKLIPAYLRKIFSGKKVLFVGCSLTKDYTLEILEECIQDNRSISHFAIVPYLSNSYDQIKRNRELARLGIEPIYYPEGDFQSVSRLISYLAEENHFILSIQNVLNCIIKANQLQLQILLSILKECFYKTALKYPQLLDIDNLKEDFTEDILDILGESRYQSDTILYICKEAFRAYVKMGYLRCEKEIVSYFFEQLQDMALKENQIENLLEKNWAIERNQLNVVENKFIWIKQLSNTEINNYACELLEKLQYKNGMNFVEIMPAYAMAKEFISLVEDRIDFDIKIRLMNSIGGFGHYFGDSETAIICLEKCISDIDDCGRKNRDLMLFKSKCYANLAITRSLSNADMKLALEAAEKDIYLKRKYRESNLLYSRSLNFYATLLKETDPFKACDIYLETVNIKEELIKNEEKGKQSSELIASWATTVFNIGLLAKDIELYDLAYRIINYANRYRFETVNYHNRDYCSSVNVCAELELFVHNKQNLKWLIKGVESRVDLPKGFAETLAHTWYVCALYYYLEKEYSIAIKYINKSMSVSKKKGALVDFRQEIRAQILYGDIVAAQDYKEGRSIYIEVINDIKAMYGNDSYYLMQPYRHLLQTYRNEQDKSEYSICYNNLYSRYSAEIRKVENNLETYIIEHDV